MVRSLTSYPRAQARCRDGSVRRASAPGPRFDSRACPFLWGARTRSLVVRYPQPPHRVAGCWRAPSLGHFSRAYPGHFSRALKSSSRSAQRPEPGSSWHPVPSRQQRMCSPATSWPSSSLAPSRLPEHERVSPSFQVNTSTARGHPGVAVSLGGPIDAGCRGNLPPSGAPDRHW